jgi:hypothetical protein
LKDHADLRADSHQLRFRQLIHALAVHPYQARIGTYQAKNDLQRQRFAGAAGAQDNLRVARNQREADVAEDYFVVEGERHVIEDNRGRTRRGEHFDGGERA